MNFKCCVLYENNMEKYLFSVFTYINYFTLFCPCRRVNNILLLYVMSKARDGFTHIEVLK